MKHSITFGFVFTAFLATAMVQAEEGGSGHYMPGATASFIDALPGKPAFVLANLYVNYDGTASGSVPIDFGGQAVLGAHAVANADTVVGLYQTSVQLLGGTYAAGVAIPFVSLEVTGTVGIGPLTHVVHDRTSGLGDIMFLPFMVGWTKGPDLKYDARLAVYAPTGSYEAGQLANAGRNYWTVEPAVSVSWLSSKIGTEASAFAGMDFNSENNDTHYKSGTSLHVEGTLAQHLPLLGGVIGVGANAFYYEQITGDSGSGATLGSFEGRTEGIGPVASYITKIGGADLAVEVKWLPEQSVEKRLKGDYVWIKAGLVF